MNDTQKTAVLASIRSCKGQVRSSREMVGRACRVLGVKTPEVRDGSGMTVTGSSVTIPETSDAVTALHAVAHLATPAIFPAHGAEFCENMLRACRRCAPLEAEMLRAEFDSRGVHYTAQHRRKAVIKAVIQRATDGTESVEAVFDDPPLRRVGAVGYSRPRQQVSIGGVWFSLSKLRYLAKVS